MKVTPYFELAPNNGHSKGRLYWIRLEFKREGDFPSWVPKAENMKFSIRNSLHISVLFLSDIQKMDANDRVIAEQYIEELSNDGGWNGNTEWRTNISDYLPHGTFHLAGFDNDERLRWLHSKGSYYWKKYGHVALYSGGI